jgi:hypothetical protein
VTGAKLLALYGAELKRLDLVLDPDEEVALAEAAALADRLVAVRDRLQADGLTVTSRAGATKAHPLVAVERVLSADVQRMLKSIKLDVSHTQGLTPAQMFRKEQKGHGGRTAARARREGGR